MIGYDDYRVSHNIYNVYGEAGNAGGTLTFHDYSEYAPAVGSNDFYSVFNNTPPDGYGFYHFSTYYGSHPLITGVMPFSQGIGGAKSEMGSYLQNSCPTIGKNNTYVFFGTNGSGGASSSTELFNSSLVPNDWSEWTGSVAPVANANYSYTQIVSNSAFKTRGGTE